MKLSAVFAVLGMASSSYAADLPDPNSVYILDGVIANGSGCKLRDVNGEGDTDIVLNEDRTAMSVLFSNFLVQAGGVDEYGNRRSTIGRKICNIGVPLHIPQGYSVSVFAIDYRGFNFLPRGARSTFRTEYFFAGLPRGPVATKSFVGPNNGSEYTISHELIGEAVVWSRCGEKVILRSNPSITLINSNASQEALSSVDSQDLKVGILYQFQWKTCRR